MTLQNLYRWLSSIQETSIIVLYFRSLWVEVLNLAVTMDRQITASLSTHIYLELTVIMSCEVKN
jgi:hypothetical protein